ncbi:MAG TPA: AAA family ATPase [Candidatus Limnocylindrales bacterium]|nr:AAA family ATPase [Candidatus Limnocylindrales bacterium]
MRKADLDRLVAAARYTGPTVKADRLVGLDACLRQLEGQIALFSRPNLAARFGLEPSGTLFVGPAGTGKTLTARYLAGRLDRPLYQVSADEFGTDPDLLHAFFRRLSKERAILFLDEVGILGRRRAWSEPEDRRMLVALLTSLDGLGTTRGVDRLWVIGACTEDSSLDPALHRSGRLGVVIEFAEPSEAQRRELFRLYLGAVPHRIGEHDIEFLAVLANGATGADIADWVNQAASEALADASDADPVIEMGHLEAMVNRRGFVGARDRTDREPGWDTAVHEAGHAVIAHDLLGPESIAKVAIGWGQRPSAVGRNFRGHFEISTEWLGRHGPTSVTWIDHAAVDLAGLCAEELIIGAWGIGAESDVKSATELVMALFDRGDPAFGPSMSAIENANADRDGLVGSEAMRRLAWRLARERMESARAWARRLVELRRDAIAQLARTLLDGHRTLGADEIAAMIGHAPMVERPPTGMAVGTSTRAG